MENIQAMKREVFARRPALKDIYNSFGHKSLFDYIKTDWQIPSLVPSAAFLNSLTKITAGLYGREVALAVAGQLKNQPIVSTIDHLGISGHPFFVNSDLIYSLRFKKHQLPVVLATESVSLNNTSSWSGSVLWHESGVLKRASFFPDRLKTLPVFSAVAISENNSQRLENHFPYIQPISRLILPASGFSHQACVASFSIWRKIFSSAPQIIYLPLESVLLDYLAGALSDPSHFLHRLILTAPGRSLWQKYFSQEHTFMFWAINAKSRREALKTLPGGGVELLGRIHQRQIYPSSPLCFIILLMEGLACVGGFTQTTWLTGVKKQLVDLCRELGGCELYIKKLADVPTKNFAESDLAEIFYNNQLIHPTALDLIYQEKDLYGFFTQKASEVTLSQSLEKAMPEIYRVVVPPSDRKF